MLLTCDVVIVVAVVAAGSDFFLCVSTGIDAVKSAFWDAA